MTLTVKFFLTKDKTHIGNEMFQDENQYYQETALLVSHIVSYVRIKISHLAINKT